MFHTTVGMIGHVLGPRFVAHNCVRILRLGSSKSPNFGPTRDPIIPTLVCIPPAIGGGDKWHRMI